MSYSNMNSSRKHGRQELDYRESKRGRNHSKNRSKSRSSTHSSQIDDSVGHYYGSIGEIIAHRCMYRVLKLFGEGL